MCYTSHGNNNIEILNICSLPSPLSPRKPKKQNKNEYLTEMLEFVVEKTSASYFLESCHVYILETCHNKN